MCADVAGGVPLEFPFFPALSHVICPLSQGDIKLRELLVLSLSPVRAVRSCIFPSLAVDLQGFEVSLADILLAKLWSACEASSQRHKGASLVFGRRPFGQHDQGSEFDSALTVKRRLAGLLFPGRRYWSSPCPAS